MCAEEYCTLGEWEDTQYIQSPSSLLKQYLQQLWDNWQHLWVTDVDAVVPIGFPLIADVAQVKDGWQQAEDPKC